MCITDIVSGLQNINSPNAFEFNSSREDKEQCKVVTLRSGKTLGNSVKSDEVEENKKGETWTQEVNEVQRESEQATTAPREVALVIPYPLRLKKSKLDDQFAKFLDVFKKLHINI